MSLQKQIIAEGNGPQIPQQGVQAVVHYTGRFPDGRVFDSSVNRGQPFLFALNQGQVIRAWDLCVSSMKQGEKCILTVPPEYGYGSQTVGPIPANSTLVFEIELLGWQ